MIVLFGSILFDFIYQLQRQLTYRYTGSLSSIATELPYDKREGKKRHNSGAFYLSKGFHINRCKCVTFRTFMSASNPQQMIYVQIQAENKTKNMIIFICRAMWAIDINVSGLCIFRSKLNLSQYNFILNHRSFNCFAFVFIVIQMTTMETALREIKTAVITIRRSFTNIIYYIYSKTEHDSFMKPNALCESLWVRY